MVGCLAVIGASGGGGGGGGGGDAGESPVSKESKQSPAPQPEEPQSQEPKADEKQMRVVVKTADAVDVDISDDNLEYWRTEQISGKKTYEFTLPKESGVSIMVNDADLDMNNDIYVGVYEDGKLVSEDSDSSLVNINY
jgi:hypothetical protein